MAIGTFLTTAEVADSLGVTPIRVRQFHREGRLTGARVGSVLLFPKDEVANFKRKKRPTGRPPKSSRNSR